MAGKRYDTKESCQSIKTESGRRKKNPFLFFLENDSKNTKAFSVSSQVTLNQTQNWCYFVLNFTNPINKISVRH